MVCKANVQRSIPKVGVWWTGVQRSIPNVGVWWTGDDQKC